MDGQGLLLVIDELGRLIAALRQQVQDLHAEVERLRDDR